MFRARRERRLDFHAPALLKGLVPSPRALLLCAAPARPRRAARPRAERPSAHLDADGAVVRGVLVFRRPTTSCAASAASCTASCAPWHVCDASCTDFLIRLHL